VRGGWPIRRCGLLAAVAIIARARLSTATAAASRCGNRNARFGCRLCGIHLCSPECYNAHVYDNAKLCGTCCAKFMDISSFKEKRHNPNKGPPQGGGAAATSSAGRGSPVTALSVLAMHCYW